MHELSITQNILNIALRYGREAQALRITDLYLVIGELSSFVDESVQFYWDIISQDTIAESARLHFRRVPAEMLCLACGYTYSSGTDLLCPNCISNQVKFTAGGEFYLEAIDILEEEGVIK